MVCSIPCPWACEYVGELVDLSINIDSPSSRLNNIIVKSNGKVLHRKENLYAKFNADKVKVN